ncbi:MAG: nucleoside hydrolase [Desulfobacteraceae bacterium]|nr:nucleoside hydrolase [Desulfobacteraceae bacterium]
MTAKKVILDLDNAMGMPARDPDDGLALALALVSPEIDLLGCTTCAGNCHTIESTANTVRMLAILERSTLPVAPGREQPFLRDRSAHFNYLSAKAEGAASRLWGTPARPKKPDVHETAPKAHEFIIEHVRTHPGQVNIVCTGSLTNLALAMLTAPEIIPDIHRVVHMGGAFVAPAGSKFIHHWRTPDIPDEVWRNTLRFNTHFDPEASAVVFRSGVSLTLVPVNVTQTVFLRQGDLEVLNSLETPFHQFIYENTRPWITWSETVRQLPGAHMHDPLALAVLIDPLMYRFDKMTVDVEAFLSGGFPWLKQCPGACRADVAVEADIERFERFLPRRLSAPLP